MRSIAQSSDWNQTCMEDSGVVELLTTVILKEKESVDHHLLSSLTAERLSPKKERREHRKNGVCVKSKRQIYKDNKRRILPKRLIMLDFETTRTTYMLLKLKMDKVVSLQDLYVMGIGEVEAFSGEVEAFSERLKREFHALEAANVHFILESEPLVDEESWLQNRPKVYTLPHALNGLKLSGHLLQMLNLEKREVCLGLKDSEAVSIEGCVHNLTPQHNFNIRVSTSS
ncbi:hypothetical protein LXL04_021850 [Taraxacum kok-saghyz]